MSGFDDIDSDISAAIDSVASNATAPASSSPSPVDGAALPSAPAPSNAGKAAEGERARGEDGKFVAKAAETPAQPQATEAPAATTEAAMPAPAHWNGEGKIGWANLPPAIQKTIAQDYALITQKEQELNQFQSVIGPERAQALAATYGSVPQAIQQLLTLSDFAAKDRPGFIRWFAQQSGIDLGQMGQGSQGNQQPGEQQHPVLQELAAMRNEVTRLKQEREQEQQNQLLSTIQAFGQDAAHPYFNDVRQHMGALMQAGKAATLQEAYDMATWAHPDVRKNLLAQQAQQQMQASAQKVQAARSAAGSLTGSPSGASVARDDPEMDLESMIRKQVNALA